MNTCCKLSSCSEPRIPLRTGSRKVSWGIRSPEAARNRVLHPQAGQHFSAWLPEIQDPAASLQVESFPEPISATSQPRVLLSGDASQQIFEHLTKECHIWNILAVLSPDQPGGDSLDAHASTSSLGNELGLRCWRGDMASIPAFQGPFDVIYLTQSAGSNPDPYSLLLHSSLGLKPGGIIVTYGSAIGSNHDVLELTHGLPLDNVTPSSSLAPSQQSNVVIFQKPMRYARRGLPLKLEGPVVEGFGRGSKQLGFPTANLDPAPLQDALAPFPTGVYWGYATVCKGSSADAAEAALAVVNIGKRPTYGDSPAISIEAHVLKQYPEDFYGKPMQLTLHGFIRPEIKFSGLEALTDQIKMDIGAAKVAGAT
ncbi:hypothetical protein WJX74_007326 [Apatococcus lobatus]|uniref:riboflavin kinase n=2 Tax=Apatococcus TaxID=904362 RepID=A0AAW1TCE8_9CHLO